MKGIWLDRHRSDVVDCHGFEAAAAAIFVSQPRTKVLSEDISSTRRDDISSQKQFEDQPLFAQLLFPLCRDISSMCQLVDSPTVFKCNSPRRKKVKGLITGWLGGSTSIGSTLDSCPELKRISFGGWQSGFCHFFHPASLGSIPFTQNFLSSPTTDTQNFLSSLNTLPTS